MQRRGVGAQDEVDGEEEGAEQGGHTAARRAQEHILPEPARTTHTCNTTHPLLIKHAVLFYSKPILFHIRNFIYNKKKVAKCSS